MFCEQLQQTLAAFVIHHVSPPVPSVLLRLAIVVSENERSASLKSNEEAIFRQS
jgi:hypothetical protein